MRPHRSGGFNRRETFRELAPSAAEAAAPISRRALLAALATAAAAQPSLAQAPRPPGIIGYLHTRTISPDHPTLLVMRETWPKYGYVEGESVMLAAGDGDAARLSDAARDLIARRAGVLIAVGAAAVKAAAGVTKTVPIVAIDLETDPIRAGLAASFNRPGGNVTGLFLDQPSLAGKWIEMLREAAPRIERVAILWDPTTGRDQLEVALDAARERRVATVVLETPYTADFDAEFARLGAPGGAGLLVLTSPGFGSIAGRVAQAAERRGLPSISYLKIYARAGMLMTYGPIQALYFARAVAVADRILRGASAAETPIERPDRFELTLNLKTAKALELAIPQTLLVLADEVIE